jgi:hypothetical protein
MAKSLQLLYNVPLTIKLLISKQQSQDHTKKHSVSSKMATENVQNLKIENAKYAHAFQSGSLPLPPAKKYLVGMYMLRTSYLLCHE